MPLPLMLLWPMPSQYVCPHVETPPVLDGRLDDAAWSRAPWSDRFVDIEGPVHPEPRHETRVKMVWDDEYFYVGAWLDEPDLWATLTKRDSIIFYDNDFEVFLNPSDDNHAYYELEVNAFNTVWDLFLPIPYRDGAKADHDWTLHGLKTAVWIDGTVNDPSDTDTGWSVEIAMPWSAFDLHGASAVAPDDGDMWRVNFSRVQWDLDKTADGYEKVPDRPEYNWVWSPQDAINMHRPEYWGYVHFTTGDAIGVEPEVDAFLPVRVYLMQVYYEQQRQRAAHGAYSRDAVALMDSIGFCEHPALVGELVIEPTPAGYLASRTIEIDGERHTWSIRQDSKVIKD